MSSNAAPQYEACTLAEDEKLTSSQEARVYEWLTTIELANSIKDQACETNEAHGQKSNSMGSSNLKH